MYLIKQSKVIYSKNYTINKKNDNTTCSKGSLNPMDINTFKIISYNLKNLKPNKANYSTIKVKLLAIFIY
jgi:hypothetical protein